MTQLRKQRSSKTLDMASEDKWFQTKRSIHVKNEYEKWNYLKTGLQPGQGFEVDGAGDCDRFKHGSGFTRRIGEPCADSRNALNNHFETRRATHDAKRHDHLHQTINRNGFDPIAHQQQSQRDDFAPRGPRLENSRRLLSLGLATSFKYPHRNLARILACPPPPLQMG